MAEKVARLGIEREAGWLYFLRDDEVWRSPMLRAAGAADGAERVAAGGFVREDGWLYFLDDDGDVARARPAVPSAEPIEGDAADHERELAPPVEKVARLGIRREPGFLYFARGSAVWRTAMKGVGAAGPQAEVVADAGFVHEDGWLYFLDNDGDVARVRRKRSD